MDLSFKCDNKKFNYRVCAMIISDNRILAMHDERSPYFYLPGGRVAMGETAEQAVIREMQEELGTTLKIIRPVWLTLPIWRSGGGFTMNPQGEYNKRIYLYGGKRTGIFWAYVDKADLRITSLPRCATPSRKRNQ